MFFKRPIDLDMIDSSSKMSLKMSCLSACDNNVQKARELYEFLADGIADIPDFEPVKMGALEQVKQGASEVFGWLTEHREEVSQGIEFIKSLKKPTLPVQSNVPPIPKL